MVLGANGLLGHTLVRDLGFEVEVWGTTRSPASPHSPLRQWLAEDRWLGRVNIDHLGDVETAIARVRPHVVINCAGVIKQRDTSSTELWSTNARAPHRIADAVARAGARLVHVSTDCVFDGGRGGYTERDRPDADEDYGCSKRDGEPTGEHVITIRSSHIGIELQPGLSLVEWAIAQRGRRVDGYRGVRYTGLVVVSMARLLRRVIDRHPTLTGCFHVASAPIRKDELMRRISDALALKLDVRSVDAPSLDRTLDGRAFEARTGLSVPDWDEMCTDLAASAHAYRHRDDLPSRR